MLLGFFSSLLEQHSVEERKRAGQSPPSFCLVVWFTLRKRDRAAAFQNFVLRCGNGVRSMALYVFGRGQWRS